VADKPKLVFIHSLHIHLYARPMASSKASSSQRAI